MLLEKQGSFFFHGASTLYSHGMCRESAHLLCMDSHTSVKGGMRMEEMRERVVLTVLLAAVLVALVWIGLMVSARSKANAPMRFADAQWTMKNSAREDVQ